MCGIAGILSLGRPLDSKDRREVRAMTSVLHHRGPDSRAVAEDERCALGNTRLRILDLSDKAALPMSNEDGTVWMCYNGEITNFRELRAEFRLDEKYAFRSTSDSEVLLRLYEDLGIGFLRRLTGMFAFCIYDKRRAVAFVVRDFYGIRPLFTMIKNGRFYFASEIKSFLELSCFDPRIDHEGICHFFSLGYIPDKHTPFEEVREIQGGFLFEIDLKAGTSRERQYYELDYTVNPDLKEGPAAEKVHELMLDSVRRNLISDAPLGLTLSGGFDTSSILALTKELGRARDIHTFSIKMEEPSFDESYYQRVMADFAGSIHHEISVGPREVLDSLVSHMAFMDEPMGDGSAIPLYILARKAKKHVSVLLSGEGGDEVFNAYETHRAYKVRKFYRAVAPAFVRRAIRALARALPTSHRKLSFDFLCKRFTEGAELSVPEAHFYWRHVLTEEEKKRLMPRHSDFKRTDRFFVDLFNSAGCEDELNRISLIDMKYFFIGDLMTKNDRVFMANSVEARFPYLDRPLVEFVSSLPTHLRVKGLFGGRYIQKQAMRGSLPKEIYRRQNMALEMPHATWFPGEFRGLAQRYFSRDAVARSGLLDYATVDSLWRQHLKGERDNGRALWCVLSFLIWFDLFVYNKDFKKYLPPCAPIPPGPMTRSRP